MGFSTNNCKRNISDSRKGLKSLNSINLFQIPPPILASDKNLEMLSLFPVVKKVIPNEIYNNKRYHKPSKTALTPEFSGRY